MLSSTDILEEIENENIVITPFTRNHLNNCSYDLTLGKYYAVNIKNRFRTRAFDPFDEKEVPMWTIQEMQNDELILEAGQTILGHSQEFVGSWGKITTKLQARSSIGRYNISVCLCAGMGDIGYFNRWTLEIKNHGNQDIIIKKGMRIAQILFEECRSPPVEEYKGVYTINHTHKKLSYQELKDMWRPDMMTPQKLKVNKIEGE